MAVKADQVSQVQVRPYGKARYWVILCLKNGRCLQATKDVWEVLGIKAAALRNDVPVLELNSPGGCN